ncbi:MAG: hypothetical protein EZS28_049817, partial [Streblomastix strix]
MLLIILTIAAHFVIAKDIYVRPAGEDKSGCGLETNQCQTLGYAYKNQRTPGESNTLIAGAPYPWEFKEPMAIEVSQETLTISSNYYSYIRVDASQMKDTFLVANTGSVITLQQLNFSVQVPDNWTTSNASLLVIKSGARVTFLKTDLNFNKENLT